MFLITLGRKLHKFLSQTFIENVYKNVFVNKIIMASIRTFKIGSFTGMPELIKHFLLSFLFHHMSHKFIYRLRVRWNKKY